MNIQNSYLAYKLVSLLSSEFKTWEAYEFGLIDEKGNTLKKPQTQEERDSFGMFHRAVRKIKVLINKFMGNSRASAILSTLYLMKEDLDPEIMQGFVTQLFKLEPEIKRYAKGLNEDVADSSIEPGKYFVLNADKEEKIVIKESLKPIDRYYNRNVYECDGILFMRDQLRGV